MFGIGETELVLILIFAFLLFGPDKLPSMGRTIGRGLRQFREAQDSVTKVVQSEVIDPITNAANEGTKKVVSKDDLDADSDAAAAAAPERPKETFAERKARLAKEKAEAAKQAEAGVAEKDEAPAAESEPAAEPEPEPEAPRKPSAASLFGLDDSGKEDEA